MFQNGCIFIGEAFLVPTFRYLLSSVGRWFKYFLSAMFFGRAISWIGLENAELGICSYEWKIFLETDLKVLVYT